MEGENLKPCDRYPGRPSVPSGWIVRSPMPLSNTSHSRHLSRDSEAAHGRRRIAPRPPQPTELALPNYRFDPYNRSIAGLLEKQKKTLRTLADTEQPIDPISCDSTESLRQKRHALQRACPITGASLRSKQRLSCKFAQAAKLRADNVRNLGAKHQELSHVTALRKNIGLTTAAGPGITVERGFAVPCRQRKVKSAATRRGNGRGDIRTGGRGSISRRRSRRSYRSQWGDDTGCNCHRVDRLDLRNGVRSTNEGNFTLTAEAIHWSFVIHFCDKAGVGETDVIAIRVHHNRAVSQPEEQSDPRPAQELHHRQW